MLCVAKPSQRELHATSVLWGTLAAFVTFLGTLGASALVCIFGSVYGPWRAVDSETATWLPLIHAKTFIVIASVGATIAAFLAFRGVTRWFAKTTHTIFQ